MKTTINHIEKKAILITVILLGFGISSVWPMDGPEMKNNTAISLPGISVLLAPSTPVTATFEDSDSGIPSYEDYSILLPTTPSEADFEEGILETAISLAPVTPAKADFNDEDESPIIWSILAPVTPKEADFTEDF